MEVTEDMGYSVLTTTREYDNNIFANIEELKLGDCQVYLNDFRKRNEGNIYDLVTSSLSEYECRKISNVLQDIDVYSKASSVEIRREIKDKSFYIEDNTYPLYKGFYCLREKYVGSNSVYKYVTMQEINLVKNYIQLVYLYNKEDKPFDEELIKSRFKNEFEYDFILPELLTSLVLGVITERELETLIRLLKLDPVIAKDIGEMEMLVNLNSGVRMLPVTRHSFEVRIPDPTIEDILRNQVCSYLTPLLHQMVNINRRRTGVNLKTVTDFRMIFELDNEYTHSEIILTSPNEKGYATKIKIISDNLCDRINKLKNLEV